MEIIASGLQFPEGPVAMPDGSVILVEIGRETLSRVTMDGAVEVIAHIPGGPNGAAIGPDGRMVVCNNGGFAWIRDRGTMRPNMQNEGYLGGSIEIVDLAGGNVERLYSHCGEHRLRGPNDLVFDATGGFWFTDLGKRRARDMDRGFVYWARPDGSEIREVIGPIFTPNGVGLSPDGGTLYVAETETGRVWSWEITAPGEVRKRPWPSPHGGTLVVGLPGFVRLDSLAIASSGAICVAALHSGSIIEITPDGSQVRHHPCPDLSVTNICFGGPELRTAFVTLSHEGRLGAMEWHEPGLRLNFQDDRP
ncbi:MAG: SMP-30/gluconolactonase/LRE family protein [Betaproteobacteria bacterium]